MILFLKDIILGQATVSEITPSFAFELLSHMKGGPSVAVLLDLALGDDAAIAGDAAEVLKTQVFLYEADTDRLEAAHKAGNALATDILNSYANAEFFTSLPEVEEEIKVVTFVVAVVVIASLQFVFYRTALGRAFRAVSDNQDIAQLMGLNKRHIFGLAMALALAVTAIAGLLLGVRTSFDPSIGGGRLIFGFEAVIIGGLGNLWGTLAGGVILGVAQTLGAKIDPGFQILAGHIAFLIVLAIRPNGLFPRVTH